VTRDRWIELTVAAALALLAAALSPWGFTLLTGRPVLSLRVTAVSAAIAIFLLVVAFALAARGRARTIGFHLMLWTFPVALLASLEIGAIALHLADRILPLEDNSSLRNQNRYPGYLFSDARWKDVGDGLRVYRPFTSDGIAINGLGLRTAAPTPKTPDEWRIAVTGGSTLFGYRVLDADTIPARLQGAIRVPDRKVTVYNFGIEGATLKGELTVLRRFRDIYAIDQVIFYTGGNDVTLNHMNRDAAGLGLAAAQTTGFELVRAALRVVALWSDQTTPEPAAAVDRNSLRDGIAEAQSYCAATAMHCDFFLQPLIFTCKSASCRQSALAHGVARLYPGMEEITARIYAGALAQDPRHVIDLRDAFDQASGPIYTDFIHVNEEGNRIAAERIAATLSARAP